MRLGRIGLMAVAVAGLLSAVGGARASNTTQSLLSDLINKTNGSNGTIVNGDKTFSNFAVFADTGDMPLPTGVTITAYTDLAGNLGILIGGNFQDSFNSSGGSDFNLHYTVTVTNPAFAITDAHLTSDIGFAGAQGNGSITESFTAVVPPTPSLAGTMAMNFNFNPAPPASHLDDSVTFAGKYTTINVVKDIQLTATSPGIVTVSNITQTFSQTTAVPVPAAAWMGLSTLAGMGGLGVLRKRSRKA
jgi:hypothetical protein